MFWYTVAAAYAVNRFREKPFIITTIFTLFLVGAMNYEWEIMAPLLITNTFMGIFAIPFEKENNSIITIFIIFALGYIITAWIPVIWFTLQLYEDDWKHNVFLFDAYPLNACFLVASSTAYWILSTSWFFTLHEQQQYVYGALISAIIGTTIKFTAKKKKTIFLEQQ